LGWSGLAARLYSRLLGPAAKDLSGTTEWNVSPDGDLWQVPFSALTGPDGKPVIAGRSISYVASLGALREIRRRPKPAGAAAADLLAFGNPAPAAGARARLPESGQEVAAIRGLYRKSIARTGAEASAAEFGRYAPDARIIHVASHAEMNNADPMYSSLLLTPDPDHADGMLPARQILDLPLRADLVILSACETGVGKAERGEGILGLGWSLAAAGASASLLSHWKVDSAATRDLMVSLHKGLAAGSPKPMAQLLREAVLAAMTRPEYRHPFYWAAFFLVGDGY